MLLISISDDLVSSNALAIKVIVDDIRLLLLSYSGGGVGLTLYDLSYKYLNSLI